MNINNICYGHINIFRLRMVLHIITQARKVLDDNPTTVVR